MNRKKLSFPRILGIGLLFLGVGIALINWMTSSSVGDLQDIFKAQGGRLTSSSIRLPRGEFHYLEVGEKGLPSLVLIHGSPGAANAWEKIILEKFFFDNFIFI